VRGAGAGSEDRRRRECTASHGRIEAGRLAVGGGGHWPPLSEGRGGEAWGGSGGVWLWGLRSACCSGWQKNAGTKAR
jgi:hypothetical protein